MSVRLSLLSALLTSTVLFPLQAQTTPSANAAVAVASSANPSTFAAPLTFTITVSSLAASAPAPSASAPTPTGTVTATLLGPYLLGSATLDSSGRATIQVPGAPGLFAQIVYGLGAGQDEITFAYSGDNRYSASQTKFTQWVNKADTSTAVTITGNSEPVHFMATVTIKNPSVSSGFALPANLASSSPTGTVQFFNGTTLMGTAPLTPSGLFTSTATMASPLTPLYLVAVYSGDSNYNGSTSPGSGQTGGAAASVTVTSSVNPANFAQTVTLNIAVTGAASASPVPTGSVTASLYGLYNLGTVQLDSAGRTSLDIPTSNSPSATPIAPWGLPAGSDATTLTYNGDAHYATAQTSFTEVVNKAATTTQAAFASTGNTPTVTAIVSINDSSVTPVFFNLPDSGNGSSPSGTVEFLSGSVVLGKATLNASGHLQSTATFTIPATAGLSSTANVVAVYLGDSNYDGSTSPPATQPNRGTATIAVGSSANPSTFAEPVTFTVKLASSVAAGQTPTGTVQASVLGNLLAMTTVDSSGKASFTLPATASPLLTLPWSLGAGSNAITISYSGDSNYQQAQATFTQVVTRAASSTKILLTPGAIGAGVFASVSIDESNAASTDFSIPGSNQNDKPTGTVTFYDSGTVLGSATLTPGGLFQSTAQLRNITVTSSLQAVYTGDSNYLGSSSPTTGTGGGMVKLTLTSSTNPVIYGAPFTLVATLTEAVAGGPNPTGTITFYDGSQKLATVVVDTSGKASLNIPIPLATPLFCDPGCASPQVEVLGAGSHVFSSSYNGDPNYAAATSAATFREQINKAPTVTALSAVSSNVLPPLPASITASVGDAQPPTGGPYHFFLFGASGLTDGNPSGTVQFFSGSTSLGTATLSPNNSGNVSSNASLSIATASTNLSASYPGDSNFLGSTSPTPAPVTVKLTSSANPSVVGESLSLTAAIVTSSTTPMPTGTVSFYDGNALLGKVTVSGGAATLAATFTAVGTHNLSATYSGDANYLAASAGPYLQSVVTISSAPGVLTISTVASTFVYGQQIVFVVGEKGSGTAPPQGTVTLFDGNTSIGGANWDLGAAPIVVTLPVGAHQITAWWPGDANWLAAVSPTLTVTVNRAPTATSLTVNSNSLTAVVTVPPPGDGTPTGSVQFKDSVTQQVLATATLTNGVAKAVLNPLSAADPVEAIYSGDTNFAPSTSSASAPPVLVNAIGVRTSTLTPDEIATIYGTNLSTGANASATLTVTDSAGSARQAYLYYASPQQIDFVVPAGTALGAATIGVGGFSIAVTITSVEPILYAANASGQGVAAAQIVRVHPDGSQAIESVAQLVSGSTQFQAAPIVFGSDSLYLVLYGTGIRHNSLLSHVTCHIGSAALPAAYAGAQPQFAGLDQVVVALPVSLKGSGSVGVALAADGQTSNSVSITFQ